MAPLLQRVLIGDPHAANARLLGELLRDMFHCQVWAAPSTDKALKLCGSVEPDLIFVEMNAEALDGIAFAQKLRRGHLTCRKAPVIMMTGHATAAAILGARDVGVHEFLRKPFTVKDLLRRLEAVTLRPRDWIEAVDYVGPDRRRFNSGDYTGALKRSADVFDTPDAERTAQALKILRSAILAVRRDPNQSMRAMQAQGRELEEVGGRLADERLVATAAAFNQYLDQSRGALDQAELEQRAAPLLSYLPKPEAGAAQAA
ncbi:MAG: response regulator [Phenylobacterium sp.]|nr:MAG: response regulator [Phenylobacterium sp.]